MVSRNCSGSRGLTKLISLLRERSRVRAQDQSLCQSVPHHKSLWERMCGLGSRERFRDPPFTRSPTVYQSETREHPFSDGANKPPDGGTGTPECLTRGPTAGGAELHFQNGLGSQGRRRVEAGWGSQTVRSKK